MKYLSIFLLVIFTSCNSQDKSNASNSEDFKASIERGAKVYSSFCIACHLGSGKGVPRAFPPLANSDFLKEQRELSIKSIKYGQKGEIMVNGIKYNGVMAPMGLSDEEVADVMNYITTNWGNENKKMITVEEVSKIKQ